MQREGHIIYNIKIIFCTDKYLLFINQRYLGHDVYTDTITFLLSTKGSPLEGEIYLSASRIKENSVHYNVPHQFEIARVIIHSCLHLCGYTDKSQILAKKMLLKQEQYLKEWIVSRETLIGL